MINSKNLKFVSFVTVGIVFSKASGFIKHYIIVHFFGLSNSADAFFVANTLAELLVNILLSGVITGALIPLLGEIRASKSKDFYINFIRTLFFLVAIVSLFCSLLFYFSSDVIADILAPGFSEESKEIVSKVLKILSPGLFFLGLIAILNGALTMNENFFLVSIGLFLANSTTIFVTILLKEEYGIYSVAIGTSLGFFAWFISHIPKTITLLKRTIKIKIGPKYYFDLVKLSIPAIVIVFLTNVIFIIEKLIASNFEQGTITKLTFTYRVVYLVANILVIPMGTVLLPNLAKKAGEKKFSEIINILKKSFIVISILLFTVLSVNILNLDLFSHLINFAFTREFAIDSEISIFFFLYSLSYIGLFYYLILMRLSYALKRSTDLIYANGMGILIYVVIVSVYGNSNSWILPAAYAIYIISTNLFLYVKTKYSYFPDKTSLLSGSVLSKGITTFLISLSINIWFIDSILYSLLLSLFVLAVYFILFKSEIFQLIRNA